MSVDESKMRKRIHKHLTGKKSYPDYFLDTSLLLKITFETKYCVGYGYDGLDNTQKEVKCVPILKIFQKNDFTEDGRCYDYSKLDYYLPTVGKHDKCEIVKAKLVSKLRDQLFT